MMRILLALAMAGCAACSAAGGTAADDVFHVETIDEFDEPWALAFLPEGGVLVTGKAGTLWLRADDGTRAQVTGVPEVDYGGQGGLGDVVLHPRYAENRLVYLSYAEAGSGGVRGAAVARGVLDLADGEPRLTDVEVIWRQVPKVAGRGHYGHRLGFDTEGYLFISSGERQKFTPAQDLEQNLGKILRLRDDGSVPDDNPFAGEGDVAAEVWTLGQRNPLGLAFDGSGRLWVVEMGPAGGDELNLIVRGENYGYPIVSNGDHYGGGDIPDHDTRPEFRPPAAWWTPVISPGGMIIYSGEAFPAWQGQALIAGLSSRALVRVALDGERAAEVTRYDFGARLRAVAQGPDGAVYLLEDGRDARLLRLLPRKDAN